MYVLYGYRAFFHVFKCMSYVYLFIVHYCNDRYYYVCIIRLPCLFFSLVFNIYVSFHFISFHFISFHFISFHFIFNNDDKRLMFYLSLSLSLSLCALRVLSSSFQYYVYAVDSSFFFCVFVETSAIIRTTRMGRT